MSKVGHYRSPSASDKLLLLGFLRLHPRMGTFLLAVDAADSPSSRCRISSRMAACIGSLEPCSLAYLSTIELYQSETLTYGQGQNLQGKRWLLRLSLTSGCFPFLCRGELYSFCGDLKDRRRRRG